MTAYLVVFDVDSTLIQDEVIELLAEEAGKRTEVEAVTAQAMAGELDFAESLIQRVANLRELPESVISKVLSRIRITDGVPQVIAAVKKNGGKVGAVSGGFNQILEPLAKLLNLDFAKANELEIVNGKLTGKVIGQIIDRDAKANSLSEWSALTGLTKTVAVGDGANDLKMMEIAELSVAFNAKKIVRDSADEIIDGNSMLPLLQILGITS